MWLKRRLNFRTVFLLTGALGWLFLGGQGCKPKKKKKKKDPPISVEVGIVSRGTIKEYARFTGDLEGQASVQVYAAVPDRIRSLRVDVGDVVKKGQVLAVIEHTRLRAGVAQARAQLAMVRSQLAGARVSLVGAKVGGSSAWREYRRLRKLLKSGAVGAQQVDLAKVQAQGGKTKVQAAQAQIQALRAQIQALRAAVSQARVGRSNAIIQAPISGIIAKRFRQQGDMNMPQMPIVSIVRMDEVKVRIQLTESDLARVRKGDKAEISVTGHPDRAFLGQVTKVSPTLDMETRTADAELVIPNVYPKLPLRRCKTDTECSSIPGASCYPLHDGKAKKRRRKDRYCVEKHPLKPGMIAKVRSLVKIHKNTILLPSSAILNDSYGFGNRRANQTLAVLVLDANNKPVRRTVKVGLESLDGRLQILKGLRVGERVIIRGHNLFRAGREIKIVKGPGSTVKPTPRPAARKPAGKPTAQKTN